MWMRANRSATESIPLIRGVALNFQMIRVDVWRAVDCADGQLGKFELNDEHRSQVRDCLRHAASKISDLQFEKLVSGISASIKRFQTRDPDETGRTVHDSLRELYFLADRQDPPIGQIRAFIANLSPRATRYIEDRAEIFFQRVYPEYPFEGNFKSWAASVPPTTLIDAVMSVTATGGQIVLGRSRGDGKRSKSRYEPRIYGAVRGADSEPRRNGRPQEWGRLELVMHLAHDWCLCTGQFPDLRRSDRSGFGNLVHSVFQWCGLEDGEATYSLRRYSAEVASAERPAKGGRDGTEDDGDDL